MADALNKKFDSDGHLIEWTDYHGYTHVNTKQIAKDLNGGSSSGQKYANDDYFKTHPSSSGPVLGSNFPWWILVTVGILFVGIILAAACAFAFMIFKTWAAIIFVIILAAFFFGTVFLIVKA